MGNCNECADGNPDISLHLINSSLRPLFPFSFGWYDKSKSENNPFYFSIAAICEKLD